MPHELFTDTFIYRTLYALTYQLLQGGGDAAVVERSLLLLLLLLSDEVHEAG